MSHRQRGVVLTDRGKQRLEAAIASAQDQEKYGARFTQTELEDRVGCDRKTIRKIRERLGANDEAFVRSLFKAFSLQLEAPDYGYPESNDLTEARPESEQQTSDSENSLNISDSHAPTKEAHKSKFASTTILGISSFLPDQRIKEIKERCCSKILQLYNEIQLLNRYRVEINRIYVDTFILEGLTSDFFATIPDLLKLKDPKSSFDRLGIGSRKERLSGLDVAKKYPRLMVLGKPGSGKSTFLRFLAVLCSRGEVFVGKIPLFIELKHLENTEKVDITDQIHKELGLKSKKEAESILSEGKLLLLLDGLDEVSIKTRRKIQKDIEILIQNYHKNRVIVTCRTQTTEFILDKFTYIDIANLNSEQIKQFSLNWFISQFGEAGIGIHHSFIEKLYLPQNQQTAELAVTPILLSLICWIYSDSGDFPEKRHKLYENGLDLLLGTWDERRGIDRESKNQIYKSLSKTEKKSLLNFIALSKFQEKQRLLFDFDEICTIIAQFLGIDLEGAHEVLSEIESQHGILIERAQEIYSFSHLTFQEFFAAKSIIEKISSDSQYIFCQYFGDRDWREIFLLVFSMLKKPDELLISLKSEIDSQILNDLKLRDLLAYLCRSEYQDQGIKKGGIVRLSYLDLLFETILNFQSIYDAGFSLSQSLADHPSKSFGLDYGLLTSLDLVFGRIREKFPESSGFQMGKEFISSLENLKSLLPQTDKDFLGWWHDNGHDWNQSLRETLDKHMGMSQYWQLTNQQKDVISTCLYSNKLLLNCIKISDFVSPEIQANIEENLLDF